MTRPDRQYEWTSLFGGMSERAGPCFALRSRLLLAVFAMGLGSVLVRATQLEVNGGSAFRESAHQIVTRTEYISAPRGRILARDGNVLAEDRQLTGIAIHFRALQYPLDDAWLTAQARRSLPRSERRNSERVRIAKQQLATEIEVLHKRLAAKSGVSLVEWRRQAGAIDDRITRLAATVNKKLRDQHARAVADQRLQSLQEVSSKGDLSTHSIELASGLFPEAPRAPRPVTIREQDSYHLVWPQASSEVIEEVNQLPKQYPFVRLVEHVVRVYPRDSLAAQIVGYVQASDSLVDESSATSRSSTRSTDSAVAGIELAAGDSLQPTVGVRIARLTREGRELSVRDQQTAAAGSDVQLTIDPGLQSWAETLLDREGASSRRSSGENPAAKSGAAVILDIETGELLVAASSPRFDPNDFSFGNGSKAANTLARSDAPMIDRCSQMALPPGSVFKPLVALALLESAQLDAARPFHCQGYLEHQDAWRCALYRRQGIGHGEADLSHALATSCNVYFLHHASLAGPSPILHWAEQFGFGHRVGLNLPHESSGQMPTSESAITSDDKINLARGIAIGQHEITTTPLQVARMMAAIASGGKLVSPTLVRTLASQPGGSNDPIHQRLPIRHENLQAVQRGLLAAVEDIEGTAHETARLPNLKIAGKTGTAQAGVDAAGRERPDHAWFAGYVPAERPRYAFCVTLEHGGEASKAAGIARQLVQRMLEANLLTATLNH